jgi:hypothetical protein
MNSYEEKIAKMPAAVRDFFESFTGTQMNLLICQRNSLVNDDVGVNTDIVADLFFKDLDFKDLPARIKTDFKFSDLQAKKLAADIVGIRLLVVDDYFSGGASAYLKTLAVPAENYQKIVADQKIALRKEKEEEAIEEAKHQQEIAEREAAQNESENPAVKIEEAIEINNDFKIDWEVEKEEVLKIFKNGLADILSANIVQEELNDVLIYLLTDKGEQFRAELEKNLLANNEVLTFAKFAIAGRPVAAVISAWLKNFISEVGSIKFDNLALTKFLTSSANAKVLSEEEKNIVKRLLMVYRNIKFFPDSMPNKTGEGWQVLPFEAEVEDNRLEEARAKIESLPKQVAEAAKAVKPAAISATNTEDVSGRLEELKVMAEKYPPNSLSRKAVVEEIKKISKK